MADPAVSVILPVYNGANYVHLAVESVLRQRYQDLELIIVDDGSTDDTPAIARSYSPRVRYVRQQNAGVATAVNHGIRLARGRFISWLSHDDVFAPDKLSRQVADLEQVNGPAVCYTDVEMIDSAGASTGVIRLSDYSFGRAVPALLTGQTIGFAAYSICYDRRCIDEVGPYSERWPYTQDAEMLLRLARRFPLLHVAEPLVQVREHAARESRAPAWTREVVVFYRKHIAEIPIHELFPDAGRKPSRRERARRFLALGDQLAAQWFPLPRVAYWQYLRAIRENPLVGFRALLRMIALWRRIRHVPS